MAAIDDSKLGVWGKTPKGGFGVELGVGSGTNRKPANGFPIPAKAFRTSICNGLAAIDDSKLRVWGKTPKTRVWGEVRGSRVVPIDSPPMVCLCVTVSSFYLAPSPSYFDGSFRDIHTYIHAGMHHGIKLDFTS